MIPRLIGRAISYTFLLPPLHTQLGNSATALADKWATDRGAQFCRRTRPAHTMISRGIMHFTWLDSCQAHEMRSWSGLHSAAGLYNISYVLPCTMESLTHPCNRTRQGSGAFRHRSVEGVVTSMWCRMGCRPSRKDSPLSSMKINQKARVLRDRVLSSSLSCEH